MNTDKRVFFMGEQSGDEWLAKRNEAQLNASCFGILFGFGYITRYQYFKEKIKKVEPKDLSDNPYVQHGNKYEQTALDWYKAFYDPGNDSIRTDHQMCLYKGIAGSPDAVSPDTVYEIKCPTTEWDHTKPVPIKYLCQLAMNMWLYEKSKGILIIYFWPMYVDDYEPEYHDIFVYEVSYDKEWFESYMLPVAFKWIEMVKKKQINKIPKRYKRCAKNIYRESIRKNIICTKKLI